MAISRGPGTEIIRNGWWEGIDATERKLIIGVQHHIYTVMSICVHCISLAATSDRLIFRINGFDHKAGTTNIDHIFLRANVQAAETFVWNDKFSFNGAESANYTGPMNSIADQNLAADQASTPVAQELRVQATGADVFEIGISYLDQNNA